METDKDLSSVIHCPSCGRSISSAVLFCPACGSAIEHLNTSTAAMELATKISDIDNRKIGFIQKIKQSKDERILETATLKAQTIRSFPVPSKRNDLIDIINMAASSINAKILMGKTEGMALDDKAIEAEKILSQAWLDKLEATYQKASALLAGDPDISIVERIYTAKKQEIDALREKPKKTISKKTKIITGVVLVVAAVLAVVILISNENKSIKEEKAATDAALVELVAEIRQDMANGMYDDALLKTNRVRYKEGSTAEEEAKWDRERETLIDQIEEARNAGK